jgi:hypothetical protein
MRYDFLVPMDEVAAGSISISVLDHDATGEELLGTVLINRRDVDRLLARRDRVKAYSDDGVTRIDLSARRYKRASSAIVRLPAREQAVRAPAAVIAGEAVEVRVAPRPAYATAVFGGNLDRVSVDACVRGVVRASGGVAVGIQPDGATVDFATAFTIQRGQPHLALWRSRSSGLSCGGKTPLTSVRNVQSFNGSTLHPSAVSTLLKSRYLPGVNRCRERQVVGKRRATGRVDIRFTVTPTGGAAKVSVKGFDQTLDACIESLAQRWRFGAPKDANGKPTSEDFQLGIRFDEI